MANLHIFATYDSFISSAFSVAKQLGYKKLDIFVLLTRDNVLSDNQKKRIGINQDICYLSNSKDYFNLHYDPNINIIIVACGNMQTIRWFNLFNHYVKDRQNRPIIITLFPGYIAGDEASIISRSLADVLLLNNQYDYELAEKLKNKYNLRSINLIYGYPDILKLKNHKKSKKIYFIDQVKIPKTKKEREYIVDNLILLANKYPNENFIILSRLCDYNEKTVHIDKYPYVDLIKKRDVPTNLTCSNESIPEAIQNMKYCLTISSTVLFNALNNNIPVGLISDFGLKNKYGNNLLKESGLLLKFCDFDPNKNIIINNQWKKQFLPQSVNIKELKQIISNLSLESIDDVNIKNALKKVRPFHIRFLSKCKKLFFHPLLFFKDMIL